MIGAAEQLVLVGARRADVERRRRVAVEAAVDRRDVDVDDVAVFERLRAGDAVADDLRAARDRMP